MENKRAEPIVKISFRFIPLFCLQPMCVEENRRRPQCTPYTQWAHYDCAVALQRMHIRFPFRFELEPNVVFNFSKCTQQWSRAFINSKTIKAVVVGMRIRGDLNWNGWLHIMKLHLQLQLQMHFQMWARQYKMSFVVAGKTIRPHMLWHLCRHHCRRHIVFAFVYSFVCKIAILIALLDTDMFGNFVSASAPHNTGRRRSFNFHDRLSLTTAFVQMHSEPTKMTLFSHLNSIYSNQIN